MTFNPKLCSKRVQIHFSNPVSRHYFLSHPAIPLQQTFASRSRLVKPKSLYFTVLFRPMDSSYPHYGVLRSATVFLGEFISETKKLHLRKIELNSHSFSEHVLIIGYVCQKWYLVLFSLEIVHRWIWVTLSNTANFFSLWRKLFPLLPFSQWIATQFMMSEVSKTSNVDDVAITEIALLWNSWQRGQRGLGQGYY